MRANTILGLVRRLLTLEAAESQDQEAVIGAAERVSEKLRAHLSKRIGHEGFRTLLARALTLTIAQFPSMNAVQVSSDGSLVGLRVAAGHGLQKAPSDVTQQDAQDAVEGAVALVAHLLALLFNFIGEDLTLRILSTVSPGLALPGLAWGDATGGEDGRP